MPSARRTALAVMFALSLTGVARADDIGLTLAVSGTIQATATVTHGVDGAHFCSASPDPWLAPDAIDGRAVPYPFYRVVFGQADPEQVPASPGPSLGMALSDYFAAARDHSDPRDDSIELVIEGRHFVGHAALGDPGYRLAVTYREDRQGGGFVARHLHEDGTGHGVIDVTGNWHCPPVAADMPDVTVSVHRLFAGAVPVRAEPAHLQLSFAGAPCRGRRCAAWDVVDQTTGDRFRARVDFRRLTLARSLRRQAERGQVMLLVDGEIRHGRPPRVVPLSLAGVTPTGSEPARGAAVTQTTAADSRNATPDALLR